MKYDVIWVWNPWTSSWAEFPWYVGGANDLRKLYGLVAYNGCKFVGPPDDAPSSDAQKQVRASLKKGSAPWPKLKPYTSS